MKVERQLLALGALAVVARLLLHALYVPAYEGPDEPFHLARVLAVLRGPLRSGVEGAEIPRDLAAAVARRPCAPDLAKAFGCETFPRRGSRFNVLARCSGSRDGPDTAPRNYENQQPPLYYVLGGLLLRPTTLGDPDGVLLALRLLSVLFVGVALFGPLRSLSRSVPAPASAAFVLALLLPGAAEGLARASNDGLVFLWSSGVVALAASRPLRGLIAILLLAPLVKLSLLPVVAFGLAILWRRSGRVTALLCALSVSATVVGLWLTGLTRSATYPFATTSLGEPLVASIRGLLQSGWGLLKTTFWVGGWTAFRPPWALTLAIAVVAAWAVLVLRPTGLASHPEHGAGLLVALAGTLLVAVGNRRFAGQWGGLDGWYLWGWSPWLALMTVDLRRPVRLDWVPLAVTAAIVVFAANVVWFRLAALAYG